MKQIETFMARLLLAMVFVILAVSAGSAQNYAFPVLLHDSGVDTLTGVATDSTLETVTLWQRFGTGTGVAAYRSPRKLLILDLVSQTISGNGEELTKREATGVAYPANYFRHGSAGQFGSSDARATIGLSTSSPYFREINVLQDSLASNWGSVFKYSNMQDASAADTDSIAVRTLIWGIY